MTKKQKTKASYQGDPGDEHIEKVMIAEIPKPIEKSKSEKTTWEIKDRFYLLKGNDKPLSKLLKGCNVHWFDEDKGYERELKYCSNQRTCFVDEMQGDQRLEHIIFRNGVLNVPKNFTKIIILIPSFKK